MLKNLLIALGIVLVALLAINDTINHYSNTDNMAITTPSQQQMRTPANQNPGQRSIDINTEKLRNRERSNNNFNPSNNPNNNSNNFDNFNRNRDRDNMRQYFDKSNSKN